MNKIEGHTHTELCPHGSKESTRKMIERAIKLGFNEYWITEHSPMPKDFARHFKGPKDDWQSEGLSEKQVDTYLKLATDLQHEYKDQIQISVGFEVEYLKDFNSETFKFLNQYGPDTQHNILSVHYLKDDQNKYWGIDYSPEELRAGFNSEIKTPQNLYSHYLKTVLESASTDFGKYQPDKLGHISLIRKFQDYFNFPDDFNNSNQKLIAEIILQMQRKNLSLDFNSAGLYKKNCNDFYPGTFILKKALQANIPIVFGSDAHAIDEIGRGYHMMMNFKKSVDN